MTNNNNDKIYDLMSSKVREMNNNIETNLNAYIAEVANSRQIRTNIIDNIRKDAESINEFIDTFNLKVKPHYIAEALSKNPDEDILKILEQRSGNVLDDDNTFTLPQGQYIETDDNDEFDVQGEPFNDMPNEPEQPEVVDSGEVVASETPKPKRQKRTYTLVIDTSISNEDDAKYVLRTTLSVTPKGKIITDDTNADLNIRV